MARDHENTSDSKSALWRLKLRLQFTGWLQYVPDLAIVIGLSLFVVLISFIGYSQTIVFRLSLLLDIILSINLIIVLINVKSPLCIPETKSRTNQSNLSMLRIMRLRRACRSFQKGNLSTEDLHSIMRLVKTQTLSSSRLGVNVIRFEYLCGPLTVWPVLNAKEFLVAIAPAEYNRDSVIDVGRCLQTIVLEATRLGIATCWIGPGASHESVIHQLGTARFDEERDHIICVCAIGYKSIYEPLWTRVLGWYNSSNRFGRFPLPQLLFHNDGTSVIPIREEMLSMEPFCRFVPCFEGCRWGPSSFNAQPTRCVVVTEENRIKRIDFYASTHSRYYAAVALGIWLANFEMACNEVGIGGYFKKLELGQMNWKRSSNDVSSILISYDMSWILRDEERNGFQS